eukprot:6283380-Karenia_brevis.AAC.1
MGGKWWRCRVCGWYSQKSQNTCGACGGAYQHGPPQTQTAWQTASQPWNGPRGRWRRSAQSFVPQDVPEDPNADIHAQIASLKTVLHSLKG